MAARFVRYRRDGQIANRKQNAPLRGHPLRPTRRDTRRISVLQAEAECVTPDEPARPGRFGIRLVGLRRKDLRLRYRIGTVPALLLLGYLRRPISPLSAFNGRRGGETSALQDASLTTKSVSNGR